MRLLRLYLRRAGGALGARLAFLRARARWRLRRLRGGLAAAAARFAAWLHRRHGRLRHFAALAKEHGRRFWRTRLPRLLALPALAALLAGSVYLAAGSVFAVYVSDGENLRTVRFPLQVDAPVLLAQAGVQLGPYDSYFYTAYEGRQAVLTVQRAYSVRVQADGHTYVAWLNGGTVQDALAQLDISLGAEDYTQPSLHHTPAAGDTVQVHRVTYTDTVVESVVPFETEYRYTSLLHRWPARSYVLREGEDGTMATVYRQRCVDGVVESSQMIDQYLTRQPVSRQVLAYGAGAPVSQLSAPEGITVQDNVPSSYRYVISGARCTGYYAARGRGASGLGLYPGTVAVDPRRIPYGTLLYITSADGSFVYGWAIATDTGTAMVEGHVDADLFYGTYLESVLNGVKYLNIYVVG